MSATAPLTIAQAGAIVDRLLAVEESIDSVHEKRGGREMVHMSNEIAEARYDLLDAAYVTHATSLPELIPQLGWAFEKLDNVLGSRESEPIEQELRAIRFALASALVVIRGVIPPDDLRCGYLVDQAVRRALGAEMAT